MPADTLEDYVAAKKPLVEAALEEALGDGGDLHAASVREAMRYAVTAGGKRLRPILVLAAAEAVKPRPPAVFKAASATEFVHTASLILDDLPSMDNATLRRGKPTTHARFGEATAILAADALLMEAFVLVADNAREAGLPADATAEAVGSLARAIGHRGMIGGQQADLDAVGKEASFETLEYICSHKTGALFTACVELGGIFSRARDFELEALRNYAKNLGLAFQVRDDVLDAIGSKEKLGKDVHQDSNRTTFASRFGVESARKAVADLCRVAEESLAALPRSPAPLVALARHVAVVEG
jgi:geranylgeranyl diphosphate synthase type II